MKHPDRPAIPRSVRIATLVAPPAGLLLLWLCRPLSLGRKLLGTAGILLYTLIYTTAIIALLITVFGMQVEWRGGFPPVLTRHKTLPDYARLESHRHAVTPAKLPPARTGSAFWTGFRGPRRDGFYDAAPIRTNWAVHPPAEQWRQPIGGGYSSFAIVHGTAFTLEQRRRDEVVTAYDLQTGAEIWNHPYHAFFDESMGGEGVRSTPTWDDGKLFSLGALGDLHCLDAATGAVQWKKNILTGNEAKIPMYGVAGSPLVVGEKLIVVAGGPGGKSVIAYHKGTGAVLWQALDDPAAYVSPMRVTLAGREQVVVVTARRVVGLSPEEGKLLWEFPWKVPYDNNIAQPLLLGSNGVMLSAGYSTGAVALEINAEGGVFSARQIWRSRQLKNKFTSSVYWEGNIYGLDEDMLTCIDAATGERRWKEGRYGYGQVVLTSGHLVILGGEGDLALVKAVPSGHEVVARFKALPGKTWNHPAIADGRLLIRNAVEMACYDISLPSSGANSAKAAAREAR